MQKIVAGLQRLGPAKSHLYTPVYEKVHKLTNLPIEADSPLLFSGPMSELINYRALLRDRYSALKASQPGFSARAFAKRAGFASPSYFSMIVSGQRKLTLTTARKISRALKLTSAEASYLQKAAELECAKATTDRLKLAEDLKKLQKNLIAPQSLDCDQYRLLAQPLALALYVLSQSNDFRVNSRWIRAQPGFARIPTTRIQEAIGKLLVSGLWQMKDEKLIVHPPSLSAESGLKSRELAMSHLGFFDMAKRSLMHEPSHRRVVGGQTFLCDPRRIPEIEKRLDQMRRELETEFECLDSTQIYQLQIGFFPLQPEETQS